VSQEQQPTTASRKGYDFGRLTDRIIRAALHVHQELKSGFREVIYQRALALELQAEGLDFSREVWIPINYRGRRIGRHRVDFVVGQGEEVCMVEIKAKRDFDPEDYMQALAYLWASGYQLGLLLNFGSKKLGIKRLVNERPRRTLERGEGGRGDAE
jgi:GxxExxY protein